MLDMLAVVAVRTDMVRDARTRATGLRDERDRASHDPASPTGSLERA